MALSYDQRKKSYDSMNDSQKQQYNDVLKSKWDDYIGNQYMQQRKQEAKPMNPEKAVDNTQKAYTGNNKQPTDMTAEEYFNNQNGTNWQNKDIKPFPELEKEKPVPDNQIPNQNFNQNVSPELDQSKFQQDPWKITVQEWTAQQTWKPDYWISTDARLNEMKWNLDHYFATSPRMFSDRETFNKVFEYNGRESEAQRQLLDSYWKRKEDMDKASQYTSWESIMNWLKNSQITTDQLNLIKENDPEAYRKWQELQEEEIKKRIVNDIVPPLMSDIANQINDMINMLWIQAQDALDIEWIHNDTMDRTWAYQTLEDCNRTVKQIEEITNKKTAIMNRYAASTWGTVSDALAAARMQKAIAPYNEQLQGLQYQYQDYSNLYSQKSATALQAANVRALQANENQRIWNQKCQALWFATSAMSYRTPEQQKQLDLQYQQAQNEMQLLQQSRLNDLNRYNAYATAKMQNQLQQELTDLSVEDENQLKANLSRVLDWYYSQRWAIIQRPQAEVVEDVIAYAKKNWITVAEALRKNFVEPLQSKKEYKTKVAQDYWMDKYQQQYSYTIDENWNVVIKASWYGEIPDSAFKSRSSRQDAYEDVYDYSNTWADYIQNLAWSIKDWSYGWQCGAFCNDILIWWWESKVFWDTLQEKINACNVDKEEWPQVWYAVVFDLWFTSKDWENHGHVGFVSNVNGDGSIDVIESNGQSDETIHVKRYSKAMVDRMVQGYYKPNNYDIQRWTPNTYASYVEENTDKPYEWVSKTTKTGIDVNAGWWITDLENEYIKEKWDNKDVMNQTLASYGISIQEYNAQKKKYLDYQAKVSLIEDTQKMYDAVKDLLEWNQKYSSEWNWSRHSWQVDLATYEAIANWTPVDTFWWGQSKFDKETANWVNKYNFLKNSQLLEKYQQLKKAGASFGAMQKSEWDLVWSAASSLNWLSTDSEFEDNLQMMLDHYANILADAGVEWFYSTDI